MPALPLSGAWPVFVAGLAIAGPISPVAGQATQGRAAAVQAASKPEGTIEAPARPLGDAGAVEMRGRVWLTVEGVPTAKRFLIRYPARARWNGRLIVAAHGGSGGDSVNAEGRIVGSDEGALDDVVGDHALERGYAYACLNRDGISGSRLGLDVTDRFGALAREQVVRQFGRPPDHVYLVGLSMGGGIARYAAEDPARRYDGILIIAGANGDVPARLERQAQTAVLWPDIDPKRHPAVPPNDRSAADYARVVGTPVAARALWPFTAGSASVAGVRRALEQYGLTGLSDSQVRAFRFADHRSNRVFAERVARENTTGTPLVPTVEVVGTFDDLVVHEVRVYREKVEARSQASGSGPAGLHRLYEVEGVWHISGDDDAVGSFQYAAKRMGLGEETLAAMAAGPSYIPTVHEALALLDRWVTDGVAAPPSRTVAPGATLKD